MKFATAYFLPLLFSTLASVASAQCSGATFEERNQIVIIEAENHPRVTNWQTKTAKGGYTGSGYIEYTGPNYFGSQGNFQRTYTFRIYTPGDYRFNMRSINAVNDDKTEHNDVWVKFPDADDFFAEKNGNRIYPRGDGRTPVPEGNSGGGWFKAYMNRGAQWWWDANTSDFDAHQIFAYFRSPGVYRLLISGRSDGHAIDRFAISLRSKGDRGRDGAQTLCGSGSPPAPAPPAPAPPAPGPSPSPPSGSCGKDDFQGECTFTSFCRSKYPTAFDCKNSEGGVCYCGDNEVCGCLAQCGKDDFQGECTLTSFCRSKYPTAFDCKNSEGGVCYCGDDEVCGCLDDRRNLRH